ncbi:hypothetical protein Thi970DRAFT_01862 [Thiorhodovibrio frisius]|uniref:Uncharacterized protein n=1 Tax=Thiorhodovibrio frisius TaxID=631362 RepID=H8Z2Q9_9GAMM|nr:hypothetical protein Thi970DRAFT_01862 [Thiorhodovibrio frisius]WPL21612.1 hypothetical protein Thiofri_01738 [Thiorhodovibrio frisius]
MAKRNLINHERVMTARTVRDIHPVVRRLATDLAGVPDLKYVKIFPRRVAASNILSENGKKNPVVTIGAAQRHTEANRSMRSHTESHSLRYSITDLSTGYTFWMSPRLPCRPNANWPF